ncbi:MAG: hypothetical protein GY861_09890 [bacterium]|nr:hypothetical protein [bacterium]
MASKADDGKTIAIISYLTWIGLLIAFIMNKDTKNDLAKFHIRQSLLIMIVGAIGGMVFWIPIIGWILGIVLFVFWVIGLIGAINGEKKEVPIIGKLSQQWFKSI